MKIAGVIPARYKSSRFPGKPLVDLCGTPMIIRVAQRAMLCKSLDYVVVATDDSRILQTCEKYDMPVIMTKDDHLTGTDRVAEVAEKTDYDVYLNIQGDEPLFPVHDIEKISNEIKPEIPVVNAMCKITDITELNSHTIPKVVVNRANYAIYLSRLAIPFLKNPSEMIYWKEVGIHGFTRESLLSFAQMEEGEIEKREGIEMLRFLENLIPIKMIEVQSVSIAVDVPGDVLKVEREIKKQDVRFTT
jgi:3-deoxy-manno-octulosonate cytidylyltransferase (CMP-KDO synthetase)